MKRGPDNHDLEYQPPAKKVVTQSTPALVAGPLAVVALFFPVVALPFATGGATIYNIAIGVEAGLGMLAVYCALLGIVRIATSHGHLSGLGRCIFALIAIGLIVFWWCWTHWDMGGSFPWFK